MSHSAGSHHRLLMIVVVLAVAAGTSVKLVDAHAPTGSSQRGSGDAWRSLAWPTDGSAAIAIGAGAVHTSGPNRAVPVASLAKVMTALVVLRSRPISGQDPGFTVTITSDDVEDTAQRRSEGQSVVGVFAGERLTEQQALQALLLPSANNIAAVLARAVSGSMIGFVDAMNAEARRLSMTSTVYTDPSGYDPGTMSTARDQLLLARAAMRVHAFAAIVAETHALLPYVGVVRNTDTLLRQDGFVGIKTGSDSAAGGCFMFAADAGRGGDQLVFGVVLGQRGGPLIRAALRAAQRLADSVRSA